MTIKELEKRIERLESEIDLLKEIVLLHGRTLNDTPIRPILPYYKQEPFLKLPYEITCKGDNNENSGQLF